MFVLVRWFWRPGSSRVAVLCFVRSVIGLGNWVTVLFSKIMLYGQSSAQSFLLLFFVPSVALESCIRAWFVALVGL